MPLSTGQILNNRYRIVRLLGKGGFGAVYRSWDLNLNRPCALKENLDTSPDSVRQFQREAQMLSMLNHPNLPRVFDHFFVTGQGQYLVMDFIEGKDLETILLEAKSQPQQSAATSVALAENQVLPWIIQVTEALIYLHHQNPPVIHRDVKPKNIILTSEGRAILVDFGIAKTYDPSQRTTLGARAVTPGFSPPEQYGQGRTDARSDVYALGATLYTSLTGQVPVEGVLRSTSPLASPRLINPFISLAVEQAILKAMELAPDRRFASVEAFKQALQGKTAFQTASVGQPIAAPAQSLTIQVSKPARGAMPAWVWIALAAAAVVIVALGALVNSQLRMASTLKPVQEVMDQTTPISTLASLKNKPLEEIVIDTPLTFTQIPTLILSPTASSTANSVAENGAISTPSSTVLLSTLTPTHFVTTSGEQSGVDGMPMILVPAGEFLMGLESSDSQAPSDEKPSHTVFLDAYWLDQTEVTNAMFVRFVDATAYRTKAERLRYGFVPQFGSSLGKKVTGADWQHPLGPGSSLDGLENHPVVQVSWDDALAYCQWAKRRLPTEAEWEKSAGWDSQGRNKLRYPWGNQPPDCNQVNYEGREGGCVGGTSPVGSYSSGASPYGALDLAGNVWEWVSDWYQEDYYQLVMLTPSPTNPTGPENAPDSRLRKVLRGGSWDKSPDKLRTTSRSNELKEHPEASIGFRCALSYR